MTQQTVKIPFHVKHGLVLFVVCSVLVFLSVVSAQELRTLGVSDVKSEIGFCQDDLNSTFDDTPPPCKRIATRPPASEQRISEESTFWAHLNIEVASAGAKSLLIQVRPHFLREIELFQPMGSSWIRHKTGSKFPFNAQYARLGGYSFVVEQSGQSAQTYYLRIKTPGLKYAVIDVSDAHGYPEESLLGIGIQLGALILILVFSMVSWTLNPTSLMFRFSCLMLTVVLGMLAGTGILAKYVFANTPLFDQKFFYWLLCLRLSCWVAVSQAFLAGYKTPQWFARSVLASQTVVVICFVLIALDFEFWVVFAMLILFLVVPVLQIFSTAQTLGISSQYRRVIIIGFTVVEILLCAALISAIFPLTDPAAAIHVSRLIDFVTPLVLLFIIVARNRMTAGQLDEARAVNTQINLNLELERKLLQERRMLIDMLAHELKNPLASISMAVGSLAKGFSRAQSVEQRRLHNIAASIRNMDTVIERCSLMNQVDNKQFALNKCELDLHAFVYTVVDQIDEEKRTSVQAESTAPISTDPYLLRIVIANLVENALKYSPEGSEVNVTLSIVPSAHMRVLRVSVCNKLGVHGGPDSAEVFKRFYRHPSAMNMPGTGLGLYLVKELCVLLDATVRYVPGDSVAEFQVDFVEPKHA